uniref:Silicon transporter 3 n=1 Tax=Ulnaria danica TaxID=2315208 RepID=A0A346T557_9STRA|nr:silicon transporter 3 [Ulnaria danica]
MGNEVEISATNNPYIHKTEDDEPATNVPDETGKVFPTGDTQGNPSTYPDSGNGNKELVDEKENTEGPRSVLGAALESFKYLYSTVLLILSLIIVHAAMFTNQTTSGADFGLHPAFAFLIFWFLIIWLAMMEGGQGALVGLQPVDKALYAESHPRALLNTKLAHNGDNMERFIVGRQYLVVLVITVINLMGSAVKGATVLGFPQVMNDIFLGNGLAMILTTIMVGQLTAQVNAANCMLDFINNYFMLFTSYVSYGIEFSGLLHCVYLVQMIFSKITGKPIESNEPPRNAAQNLFFWARVIMSVAILCFCLAVTLVALFDGKTGMWDGVPPYVSVIILFILMAVVGMMEGMQIALFAVVNMPEEELRNSPIAYANCQLTFAGQNLQAFLIGRQIFVATCMFIVARIASPTYGKDDANIFGISDGFQSFLNSGLTGAVITTVIGSLAWRIIASSFPLAFLSNPLIYIIIRVCLVLENVGICSGAWVLGRFNKLIAGYQPDEVYLEGAERHTSEPVTRRDGDIDRLLTVFKFIYSTVLLVLCLIIVHAAMFTNQTTSGADFGLHPAFAFLIFWFLIIWLAMMEGGQGALVGLQPVDKALYAESHPRALLNTKLAHNGDNMERFIVGRQYLVVLVITVINLMGSAVKGATVLGFPQVMNDIFLGNGLAMILTTIMVGQLTAQVNAANCMLDFINNYFMLFTSYVSYGIEFSGLLHCVYLVQMIFSKITGKPIESNEPPRNAAQNLFFWARVIMSVAILCFCLAVTLVALFDGKTGMWDGVPPYVSVIILFVLMAVVGMMEGMQIALFAVVNMPEEELRNSPIAYANCQLTFAGQNLQAFLIGRQIFVATCMFIVARIASPTYGKDDANIFGISDGFQSFLNSGLTGAVITTVIGSLAWRIIASSFPLAFLSNPLIYIIIRVCLFLESIGICSGAWVLGRFNKLIAGYQPDEVYLEGAERHTSAPVTKRDKDIDIAMTTVKYLYSTGLLVFSVVIVMSAMFTEQTKIANDAHPAVAFFLFWFLIVWLAMMEGGQGCLIGLKPIDKNLYKDSHKVTYTNCMLAHKGDNMERFIVGRQFLVVLVITVINLCGSSLKNAKVLGLDDTVTEIFLGSGVAMILTTIILGQLTAQVNAANCMLDFINTYFMLFTSYVSLGIEFSGLLHSVYLVQIVFSKITGKPIESNEPPRTAAQNLFFWARVLISLVILSFSLAVTLVALFDRKTSMYDGVPPYVSVIVFFVLMCVVGMMEGMQIALFAVINLPEDELKNYSMASKNCSLAFQGTNLQSFLIGRQIFVATCMFVVARIASPSYGSDDSNIFGVSDGFQTFLNTGLTGAIITTLIGSLAWRIIASSFPVAFLSNPLIYFIIRVCLLLDAIGLCSAAWLLALIHKQLVGFQIDEVYIGKPSDRAAAEKAVDEELAQE